MSRRITGLASLHSPEKSLNSAEIEQLQGRILVLEIDKVRLKASIAADATRRREAETALADSGERYRTLFNSPVDLLISDVGLPGGMNGRQLADAARTARPELKVLFITGYAENAIIGNGQLEPGMRVQTKPFVVETFAARVLE